MKKILAILLSVSLVALNTQPAVAQLVSTKRVVQATKALKTPGAQLSASALRSNAAGAMLGTNIERAAWQNMRLPLTQNYSALLGNSNPMLSSAHKILAHNNAQERALLLRSDFAALALNNQASAQEIHQAADFYRANLQKESALKQPAEATADIAALGLFGSAQQDAKLIFEVARQAQELAPAQEALVVAAAARALLRLQAYTELTKLSMVSNVQPQLWEGIAQYARANNLPLEIRVSTPRQDIDVKPLQAQMQPFGPLNTVVVDPSQTATFLYMNAGRVPAAKTAPAAAMQAVREKVPFIQADKSLEQLAQSLQLAPVSAAAAVETAPVAAAAASSLEEIEQEAAQVASVKSRLLQQTERAVVRAMPFLESADGTSFFQRAALYLTAFSIGLEIGTPIMASIKSALNLPLSSAIFVTVATFSPYVFGPFIANWLKTKVGQKGTINTGLGLAGGSFVLGAAGLGFDGSFTAWDDPMAQFLSLLTVLMTASTGCVFIHTAVGPIMTEISKKANILVRQNRGAYVELSRSVGMMSSFAFPFLATGLLGLDWSAPFILALPIVAASAAALNFAKLPNTKPEALLKPKTFQSPVVEPVVKERKAMSWKNSILNNGYVRLLREEPGVSDLVGSLFLMNAVEVALNSGFLFMIPQLTTNESTQYLLGMAQYALAFFVGRGLASPFLKWFPKRNMSVATALAAAGGLAALGATHDPYALTAALFTAEVGISTTFTLSFASTAKHTGTQDRITALIMVSAISCALGPVLLTQAAQWLINAGVMTETDATIATLIAVPSLLAVWAAKLLRKMENITNTGLTNEFKDLWTKVKNFFNKK